MKVTYIKKKCNGILFHHLHHSLKEQIPTWCWSWTFAGTSRCLWLKLAFTVKRRNNEQYWRNSLLWFCELDFFFSGTTGRGGMGVVLWPLYVLHHLTVSIFSAFHTFSLTPFPLPWQCVATCCKPGLKVYHQNIICELSHRLNSRFNSYSVFLSWCNMTQWMGLGLTWLSFYRQAQPFRSRNRLHYTLGWGFYFVSTLHPLALCAKTHKVLKYSDGLHTAVASPSILLLHPASLHSDRRSCFAVESPTPDAGGSCPCCCSSPLFLT